MDHLVLPLDHDHVRVVAELGAAIAAAAGLTSPFETSPAHITLIAYEGSSTEAVTTAVGEVVAATAPFMVHAHGYGFFAGDAPSELSLHVTVAKSPALATLHRDLCVALGRAGAVVAGWSVPEVWLPHITLLDRQLGPASLGAAAAFLAARHHPSWHVPIDRVAVTGGWPERTRVHVLRLGRGVS